jgi:hypothetical protein
VKKLPKIIFPHSEVDLFSTIYVSIISLGLIFGILTILSEIFKATVLKPKQEREHQKLVQYLQR